MTTGSLTRRVSTLPDYYADERRALNRVRIRHTLKWIGVVVGVLGMAGTFGLLRAGISN